METNEKVVKNIQQSAKDADELILWLDCDREGEAIAFDVRFTTSNHELNA